MSETPTRRRLLRAVGATATVTLAGCSSNGEKGTTSAGTTDGGQTTGTTKTGTGATTTGAGTETTANTDTATGTNTSTTEGTTAETTTEGTGTETTTTTNGTAPPKGGGDVQFAAGSGATVHGTLLGNGDCSIVFAHDVGFDRKDWLPEAKKLVDRGYTCLLIDLNLEDRSTTAGYVLAASRYLRQRVGVKNVVLVGAGAGANAVVRANARAKSGTIAGTFAFSPGKGVDSATAMQGWKLFVASEGDDEYVQKTKKMYEAASDPKRFETIGGSAHGQRAFEENEDATGSLMNSLLMTVCG